MVKSEASTEVNAEAEGDDFSIRCFVYKGHLHAEHFLFLPCLLEDLPIASELASETKLVDPKAEDEPHALPIALLKQLGELRFVTEFELHAQRRLPQAEAVNVIAAIQRQGFYLQRPKKSVTELEDQYFA